MPATPVRRGVVASTESARVAGSLLGFAALLNGTDYVVLKVAMRYAGPFTVSLYRSLAALVVLIAVARVAAVQLGVPRGQIVEVLRPALLIAVSTGTFTWSLLHLSAGLTSIVMSIGPIVGLALAWLVVGERPTRLGVLGATVGIGGIALTASVAVGGSENHPGSVALAILSVIALCLAFTQVKRIEVPIPQTTLVCWIFAASTLVFIPPAVLIEGVEVDWHWEFSLTVLYSGGVVITISLLTLMALLSTGSVLRVTLLMLLIPVFANAGGVLLLDEPIYVVQVVGGLVTFAGIVLILYSGAPRPSALRS